MARIANRKGIGFKEVIFVVGALLLLLALILPSINLRTGCGSKPECINNLSQVGKACISYSVSKGVLPRARRRIEGEVDAFESWVPSMLKHLGHGDKYENRKNGGNQWNTYIANVRCPTNRPESRYEPALSYLLNGGRQNVNGLDFMANGVCDETTPASLDYVARNDGASNTILAGESLAAGNWDVAENEYDAALLWDESSGKVINTSPAQKGRPSSKHAGGANIVFCDGSVHFISEKIDSTVYGRLMSSNGTECLPPGTSDSKLRPPLPRWQGVPLMKEDLMP